MTKEIAQKLRAIATEINALADELEEGKKPKKEKEVKQPTLEEERREAFIKRFGKVTWQDKGIKIEEV